MMHDVNTEKETKHETLVFSLVALLTDLRCLRRSRIEENVGF